MGSAYNSLSLRNGLKTTQSVLSKQQSGQDAQQKANPQEAAAQMNMNTAQAMMQGKPTTPPTTASEKAARLNQETAEGMLHGEIPIVKKEEPKKEEAPKQMSYAEMFKALHGDQEETEVQKARREKRERTNARIAAIGDGLRALSNMYFATQGAKVIHDPKSDLTVAMAKRQAAINEQREKNKTAWQNGYLKAQALDEEARKNKETLAETVRYHNQLAENRERVGNQNDTRLQQSQDRIDLSRYRIESLNDYNERKLQIDKDYKDGLLSAKAKSNAIAELNASANMLRAQKSGNGRGGSSSSRNGSYSGNVEEYIKLKQEDPKGMKEAESEAREMGYSPKTASGKAAARVIYKRKHGKTTKTGNPAASGGGGSKGNGRSLSGIK